MQLSGRFEIQEIIKKTSANGWKKLKVGDIITITLPIECNSTFCSHGYTVHQIYPNIQLDGGDLNWSDSFNRIFERMNVNFKLKQID